MEGKIPETITLTSVSLQKLLNSAAELGARRALIGAGMESPTLSWNMACKRFGKTNMELWRKTGRITPIQQGMNAAHKYSVQELVTLALIEERHNYLSLAERKKL